MADDLRVILQELQNGRPFHGHRCGMSTMNEVRNLNNIYLSIKLYREKTLVQAAYGLTTPGTPDV